MKDPDMSYGNKSKLNKIAFVIRYDVAIRDILYLF